MSADLSPNEQRAIERIRLALDSHAANGSPDMKVCKYDVITLLRNFERLAKKLGEVRAAPARAEGR